MGNHLSYFYTTAALSMSTCNRRNNPSMLTSQKLQPRVAQKHYLNSSLLLFTRLRHLFGLWARLNAPSTTSLTNILSSWPTIWGLVLGHLSPVVKNSDWSLFEVV